MPIIKSTASADEKKKTHHRRRIKGYFERTSELCWKKNSFDASSEWIDFDWTILFRFTGFFPNMDLEILSGHVLRNQCTDFSENLYTHYSPYEDVHLVFSF